MKAIACASLFICFTFVSFSQEKHYKNQINRTLTEKVTSKPVVEAEKKPSLQTPKYQATEQNVRWVDTAKKPKNPPSYKQHGGRPN
jgi:hypothetical protein